MQTDGTILEIHGKLDLTREEISPKWYDVKLGKCLVTYQGLDMIDEFYPKTQELLYPQMADSDCQECYLAYDPANDEFVMAFDTWFSTRDQWGDIDYDPGSFGSQVCTFRYDAKRDVLISAEVEMREGDGGFYKTTWEEIQKARPELVELRLD